MSLWDRVPKSVVILVVLAFALSVFVLPPFLLIPLAHIHTLVWAPWRTLPYLLHQSTDRATYGFFVLLLIGAALYVTRTEWGAESPSQALGAARFRDSRRDLTASGLVPWDKPLTTAPPQPGGLVVGMDPRGTAYVLAGDEHTIIIGTTGSRKTSNVLLPSFGVLGQAGESLIVTDPKGELYQKTADWLTLRGYHVYRHDTRQPALGHRINPMTAVNDAFHPWPDDEGMTPEPDWAAASMAAARLANTIVGDEVGSEGPMWRDWSRDLIAAGICAVADLAEPESQNISSVANLITGEQDEQFLNHLFSQCFPPDHPARRAFASIRNSSDQNRTSILSTTGSKLGLFRQGSMAWMLSHADYDLADIGRRKTAIYVVFPPNDSTFHSIITMYLHQVLQTLSDLAFRTPGRRLPVRVNLLLDEFGSFPSVPDFEATLATCRSEGVRMNLVIQSYNQLASHYKEGRDGTIRDNCNTTLFLNTNRIETARDISERLGQMTVHTHGRSSDMQADGRTTTSTNETTRALKTADEIMNTLKPGTNLLLQTQQYPATLTMHRIEDYQQFQWHDTPDDRPPRVTAPPVWPGMTIPGPDTVRDPALVLDPQTALPEDARVVERDWDQVFG